MDQKSDSLQTMTHRQDRVWRSCCMTVDKQFVMFTVQTVIGIGLLSFCAWQLATEPDCERNSPYWGLIGTMCGFFFRKVSFTGQNTQQKDVHVHSIPDRDV